MTVVTEVAVVTVVTVVTVLTVVIVVRVVTSGTVVTENFHHFPPLKTVTKLKNSNISRP